MQCERFRKKAKKNNNVKLALGTKEIEGKMGPGTGDLVKGTAKFMKSGPEFDMMKQNFFAGSYWVKS